MQKADSTQAEPTSAVSIHDLSPQRLFRPPLPTPLRPPSSFATPASPLLRVAQTILLLSDSGGRCQPAIVTRRQTARQEESTRPRTRRPSAARSRQRPRRGREATGNPVLGRAAVLKQQPHKRPNRPGGGRALEVRQPRSAIFSFCSSGGRCSQQGNGERVTVSRVAKRSRSPGCCKRAPEGRQNVAQGQSDEGAATPGEEAPQFSSSPGGAAATNPFPAEVSAAPLGLGKFFCLPDPGSPLRSDPGLQSLGPSGAFSAASGSHSQ